MQTGKKAVETVKETTSNIAASAKSGMDKTKATVQEKLDKMTAKDDYDKAIATEKKEGRVAEAELRKQQAMGHNAAEKDANVAPTGATKTTGAAGNTAAPQYSYTSTGHPTTMTGHATHHDGGHVMDGSQTGSHPTGNATETTFTTHRHVGGRTGTGHVD